MRFQLLGPLSIVDGEQGVVLQPSKPTSLLAALLLHSGSVVSADYLMRVVWDAEAPASARAALQSCVLRLRRIFAKYGIANDAVEAVPGGYRMRLDGSTLDLLHFRALVASADSSREVETEARLLRKALALWRGPVLANVSSPLLHRDMVPRLTEERLRALERLCDIELAFGQCREVLTLVWDAARSHPERERFAGQLAEALYRTGRQTEALEEIRAVKKRLREGFGIDPGPALQRLELTILRGEPVRGDSPSRPAPVNGTAPDRALPEPGVPEAEVPAERGTPLLPGPSRTRLPGLPRAARTPGARPAVPPVAGFTGRSAQLAAIQRALTSELPQGSGPVVISGAPGIGKTALALQAAHLAQEAFPGGCSTLVMTKDDGSPLTATAALAKLPPAPVPGRRLLILDDAVSAEQIRPLIPPPSDGAVMVTSRRGLAGLIATHGGVVHRLDVLDEEEVHAFLVGFLGAERIAEEPRAARELARVCGYFPLGLRIAAARLLTRPHLGIGECVSWLAADLPARLALADEPRMSVPGVFGAALDRLAPELREAFLRLAAGPPDVTAPEVPEDVLERLADAGFIEEGPPKPYRIHALLRIYARRQAVALPHPRARTALTPG